MSEEDERVPEIFKRMCRIGGWTSILAILTFLIFSVTEGKGPFEALADLDPYLGLIALLICVVTASIFEVITSIRSPG